MHESDDLHSYQYILDPVSGDGKLAWLKGMDPSRPKYELSVDFHDIAFNLDDRQYATFVSVFGAFSRQVKSYPFRQYRPPRAITPKIDPKAWFKYAGTCVLTGVHEARRKWSWAYFKSRRTQRNRYTALYRKLKMNAISTEELDELDELEIDLSFEDIRLYRRMVKSKLKTLSASTLI
jgi:vacuolar protein sorting-associated protein 13A/C